MYLLRGNLILVSLSNVVDELGIYVVKELLLLIHRSLRKNGTPVSITYAFF